MTAAATRPHDSILLFMKVIEKISWIDVKLFEFNLD